MDDLKNVWGEPQEYKEIKIYPIKLKDMNHFYDYAQCLMFEKNKIPDVEIIKLSYLDFLFAIITREKHWYFKLFKLMELVLKNQRFSFSYSENETINLEVNSVVLDGNDFENIRKIILKQNLIPFDEQIYDPEIEAALKEAEEFLNSKNGKSASFEERIIALHCLSGTSFKEIREYTIYQFNKILERYAIIKNYEILFPLLAQNGEADSIQHWLCHIEEKDKYANVIMSKDEFDKITADKDIFSQA